jgi:hypothetical protein
MKDLVSPCLISGAVSVVGVPDILGDDGEISRCQEIRALEEPLKRRIKSPKRDLPARIKVLFRTWRPNELMSLVDH